LPAVLRDKRQHGRPIEPKFLGEFTPEQDEAAAAILRHESVVLAAITAYGKTVIAAKIISERKRSTLVLVHRRQLLDQWAARLSGISGHTTEKSLEMALLKGRQSRNFMQTSPKTWHEMISSFNAGRSPAVITERKDHLNLLAGRPCKFARKVIVSEWWHEHSPIAIGERSFGHNFSRRGAGPSRDGSLSWRGF
jgi:hypothetical protein